MTKYLAAVCVAILLGAVQLSSPAPLAQDAGGGNGSRFRPEELDQMLAPVALYPDSLLAQVLMASTYPGEISEAADFAYDNSDLTGDSLVQFASDQDWDPSVKSLLDFPDILGMLNDRLEWTRDMGDAFLGQQRDVMDSVQRLRANAQAAGNLYTTKEQLVHTQSGITIDPITTDPIEIDPITFDPVTIDPIIIDPVDSDTLYAPVYDPDTIYGSWWWPDYPPYYYYPPAWSPGRGMAFAAGVAIGRNWSWGTWNWTRREVGINTASYNSWTKNHYSNPGRYQRAASAGSSNWQHDPSHRLDEPYRDRATSQRYGQTDNFRGGEPRGADGGSRLGDRGFDRQGQRDFDRPRDGGARDSIFDGAGASAGDRAASMRGMSSRGGGAAAPAMQRPGGFGGGGRRR